MREKISLLTSTYNRSSFLVRLFTSIKNQTCKDFEWVIVDDGSKDNTKEIIEKIIEENPSFQIRYFYQENQGKHIALNKLFELANGKYAIIIDDDDELLPDAIEKSLIIWNSIENQEQYWCVCARCINSKSKQILGALFPKKMNNFTKKKQMKVNSKISGEKVGVQKVEIVKRYKFPKIEGCYYIPEAYLWNQLNRDYKQYYSNEVLRIYHQFEIDSLVNTKVNNKFLENMYHAYKLMLSNKKSRPNKMQNYFICILFYVML